MAYWVKRSDLQPGHIIIDGRTNASERSARDLGYKVKEFTVTGMVSNRIYNGTQQNWQNETYQEFLVMGPDRKVGEVEVVSVPGGLAGKPNKAPKAMKPVRSTAECLRMFQENMREEARHTLSAPELKIARDEWARLLAQKQDYQKKLDKFQATTVRVEVEGDDV